jgi:myo-inositol-1(or 4)-monophosphatase
MHPCRPETSVAASAVRAALTLAQQGPGTVRDKPGRRRDVVTDADVAVEDLLRARLEGETGIAVVGEERGGQPREDRPYWMVDPICGTRNFASGIPFYAVNVCLVEDQTISLAAVGDGSTGSVLVAEKGRGAFALLEAGDQALAVAPSSTTVAVGVWPQERSARAQAALLAATLLAEDRFDLRVFASTLGLAYLAQGRIGADVYFAASPLHFGAGALVAAEAGARVSELDGSSWSVHSTNLLASSNDEIHATLLGLFERLGIPEGRASAPQQATA